MIRRKSNRNVRNNKNAQDQTRLNGFEHLENKQLLTATLGWVQQTAHSTVEVERSFPSVTTDNGMAYMMSSHVDTNGDETIVVTSHDSGGNETVLGTYPSTATMKHVPSAGKMIAAGGNEVFHVFTTQDVSGPATKFLQFNTVSGASQLASIPNSISIESITAHDSSVYVGGRKDRDAYVA